MIAQLRYKRLYVLGVDLYTKQHFFSANVSSEYERIGDFQRTADVVKVSPKAHDTAAQVINYLPRVIRQYKLPAFNLSPLSKLQSVREVTSISLEAAMEQERKHQHLTSTTEGQTRHPLCVFDEHPPRKHPAWTTLQYGAPNETQNGTGAEAAREKEL